MRSRLLLSAAVLALFAAGPVSADDPPGVEVLARGPVHEAYATTVEFPMPGAIVAKAPPAPIEELPPDQKPEGDNVQWLPGYWSWDEERSDHIWISGFWRVPPPGRVWVAGSWREARGGWQWVQGFWQDAAPQAPTRAAAPQAEIEYLPPPPQPLEVAPSIPAPTATSLYIPGNWVWRGRYVWRPGFYIDYRPGWVWIPAHYRWSNCGYIYVEGYWDYPLETRGVLFAPVVFAPAVYARPAFVYTPTYVVSHNCMVGALFVRRGHGCYYFGDYFEPRYATIGYTSWCGSVRGTNFAVSVGFGRGVYYDPMWSYYQVHHRHDPVWVNHVTEVYVGRYRGDVPRPPRTLVQQTTVVNNITNVTNVTNNKTVVNNVSNVTMVAPLKNVQQTNNTVVLKSVEKADRVKEQQHATELRQVGTQRQKLETTLADRNLTPTQPTDKPRQVKLDVPQQVSARAQMPTAPAKAPPPPAHMQPKAPTPPAPVSPKTATPVPPGVDPKPAVKPATPGALPLPPAPKPVTPLPPKVDPKPVVPPSLPKTDLPPKVEPKPVVVPSPPKVEPKPALPPAPLPPKADPKPLPALPPSPPKVDPKPLPALPPSPPKVDPKPSLPPPAGKPDVKPAPAPVAPKPSTPPPSKPKDEKKKDQK